MKPLRLHLIVTTLAALLLAVGLPRSPAQDDPPKTSSETEPVTGTKDEEAKPAAPSAPKTHTVKAGTFRIETSLDGILEATGMRPISLRPEVWSTLEVVKAVPHGTRVEKGDQLVWLETKDLDELIRETELAVVLGELSLKEAKEDLRFFEATTPLDLALAERAKLDADRELSHYLETDRPLSERSARHSLKSSEGTLENAMEELQQLEKMYKADDLTEETEEIILKRAKRGVESAELFLELAKVRTERTLKESIPEREQQLTDQAQRQELSLAKLKLSVPIQRRQKEIALEKLVRSQEKLVEKLEKLKQDRQLLNVTAPLAGVVYYGGSQKGKWTSVETIAKQLEPGKSLTANQEFMTIVQLRPIQVHLNVAEKDLRHVRKGVAGEAIPTAFPERKIPAEIAGIGTIPSGTTTFDATASLKLEKGEALGLVPGMTCKVNLVSYEKKNALTIPEAGLFYEDDNPEAAFVYLTEGKDQSSKQPVEVGEKDKGQVEIVNGLTAGDKILLQKPKDAE